MSASNDAFRRISPLLRTLRVALSVSDSECVLLDDVRVRRRADGALEALYPDTRASDLDLELDLDFDREDGDLNEGRHAAPRSRWIACGPFFSPDWVVARAGVHANRVWRDMLTEQERSDMHAERSANLAGPSGSEAFCRRVMRRLLGYGWTAGQTASLCSMAVARLIDPEIPAAVRRICGWRGEGAERVMRAWSRVDAHGRQVGLSSRPVQVSCLALMLHGHVERQDDGVVGILESMPEVVERRQAEIDDYVSDPFCDEYLPTVPTTRIDDLCEIADLLPSSLRAAGVGPAFWRMALRMTPSQIRALKPLFSRRWSKDTAELLNALAQVGPALLPPTLIRTLAQQWVGGWPANHRAIALELLHRAASGIAARKRRQPLGEAVQKLLETVDHLSHLATAKARSDREAAGLPWDDATGDGLHDAWHEDSRETVLRQDRDVAAAIRAVLPRSRSWTGLVAASDAWHAEAALAMDEGDSRSWPRLIGEPLTIDGITVVELDSASSLRQETRELDHCVGTGGYADRCMRGGTRILSLRIDGRRTRSTMEISLHDGTWRNVQHRGRANSVPKPALRAVERETLKRVNAAHRKTLPKPANDWVRPAEAA